MTYEEMKGQTHGPLKQKLEYRAFNWCSFGAVAGLAGGIGAALLGSILTAISWLNGAGARVESVAGTVLLVLTIPLLILGAQCFDLMDKKKDRAREARFRKNK